MFSQIFDHLVNGESEYVNVEELVGEENLRYFAENYCESKEFVVSEDDFADQVMEVASSIYLKFGESPDVMNLNPEDFEDEIEQSTRKIADEIYYGSVNQFEDGEEAPLIIDIFQVENRITFAFEISEREEIIEEAMNRFVEIEDYEMAAKARDLLDETKQ